jgi:hypothetical protein
VAFRDHTSLRLAMPYRRITADAGRSGKVGVFALEMLRSRTAFVGEIPTRHRSAADARLPGRRAVAYLDGFPIAFIGDMRGMSLTA